MNTEILQGAALRLNCSISPPGCATVDRSVAAARWYFAGEGDPERPDDVEPSVTAVTPHDEDSGSEYLMTRTNELVVLSANTNHSGTYTCFVDGRTVSRHHVRVLRTCIDAIIYIIYGLGRVNFKYLILLRTVKFYKRLYLL